MVKIVHQNTDCLIIIALLSFNTKTYWLLLTIISSQSDPSDVASDLGCFWANIDTGCISGRDSAVPWPDPRLVASLCPHPSTDWSQTARRGRTRCWRSSNVSCVSDSPTQSRYWWREDGAVTWRVESGNRTEILTRNTWKQISWPQFPCPPGDFHLLSRGRQFCWWVSWE